MKNHLPLGRFATATIALLFTALLTGTAAVAQMDRGPTTEKTYGIGLPRDHATQLFRDEDYPVFALKPGQEVYKNIDGARMKKDIIALSKIALNYRDTVNKQWWGILPGTSADKAAVKYMTDEFTRLGLTIQSHPFTLPTDWRPQSWSASYTSSSGATVELTTTFPVSGTKATGPEGITAEAIWVGIGAEPDFIGRDVKGKAVIIYSTFVPGGRSHSASNRSGLFNANTRAQTLGAAMVINVMAVPGNGLFQPEDGLRNIPQMTMSQDEGFALRDRLGKGEKITVTLNLNVPPLKNIETVYTYATLPGRSDEEIMLQVHTDGFFQAATDNNSGMAAALELARHYAALPREKRPRTLVFLLFPDHHHGEVAHRMKGGIDEIYDWSKVALKLTIEHPSETSLYLYNSGLTATNNLSAVRWNALGSPEFERMVFNQLRDFGVSVYGVEDTPKNGNFAPSFHIINHILYHTSLDTPEMVPAEGMQRSVRAFASIIDHVNAMSMAQVRGPNFPPKDGRGTVIGPIAR
jgi:Peptidase family M28